MTILLKSKILFSKKKKFSEKLKKYSKKGRFSEIFFLKSTKKFKKKMKFFFSKLKYFFFLKITHFSNLIFQSASFKCKVTAHWHNGTAYVIQFDESVIARENSLLDSNR